MKNKHVTKLTAQAVAALPTTEKAYRAWDTEIKGFYLRISPAGTKTYRYFYRVNGTSNDYLLGRHGSITADEARKLAKAAAGDVAKGINPQQAKKAAVVKAALEKTATLGAFLNSKDGYRAWAAANLKSHKETLRMLDVDFRHLHSKRMADITPWDVQKWQTAAARGESYSKPLTASSINRRTAALKSVLSTAVKWGRLEASPLAGMARKKTDNKGRVRYLSSTEEKALRRALDGRQNKQRAERVRYNQWRQARHLPNLPPLDGLFTDHLKPLVIVAINTGLRRGELFNLLWADVVLSKRQLTVRGEGAKSGQSRHVPLNDEAFATLTGWANQTSSRGLVFPSPATGQRLDNINSSWAGLVADAGLVDFRFHDCRHHFASQLVMRGCDINTVRELLGHASIEQTLKYAHLAPEHKAAAVQLLNT